ncbi:hypothetical protein F1D05_30050 [Kribbella qitaiheensis]|uniref:Trp biosynthesis-associated membrane protein n=1 Tax=Kribbella qitaiheensis TaxID=1544730 RepID=A0A7G6X574_9ACTN|nr:hypothetical protein [Kribbella qitaiheensis]QNE21389.1 hypothetical protein F1D05_30050 [Kribbella qitaiheensis]
MKTRWMARVSLPAVLAVLLMASAALLVVGAAIEHGTGGESRTESVQTGEAGEGAYHDEAPESAAAEGEAAHGETVLGMELESPVSIAALVVVSLALAGWVWRRPTRLTAAILVVFAAVVAVADGREVGHQLSGDHAGLAAVAAVLVVFRLATIIGAAQLWRSMSPGVQATAPGA